MSFRLGGIKVLLLFFKMQIELAALPLKLKPCRTALKGDSTGLFAYEKLTLQQTSPRKDTFLYISTQIFFCQHKKEILYEMICHKRSVPAPTLYNPGRSSPTFFTLQVLPSCFRLTYICLFPTLPSCKVTTSFTLASAIYSPKGETR
jgi:hypothetical protein